MDILSVFLWVFLRGLAPRNGHEGTSRVTPGNGWGGVGIWEDDATRYT